jgi:23S rRNA (guanine745-N1)-methyltransferase
MVCPTGHSYDIARSGYVNLLQPQDRRSRHAGDSRLAIEARSGLLAAGVGQAIVDDVVRCVKGLDIGERPLVVDLGAGSGDLLAALASARTMTGVGIDLSTAAAGHAARRFPHVMWVVANADRCVPIVDGCAQLVLSVHARRNPRECARVLSPAGFLLVVIPAPDDLIELRAHVGGQPVERSRGDALVTEHDRSFKTLHHGVVRDRRRLERPEVLSLLLSTYRGGRRSAAARVEALGPMEVTVASEVFVFGLRDQGTIGRTG